MPVRQETRPNKTSHQSPRALRFGGVGPKRAKPNTPLGTRVAAAGASGSSGAGNFSNFIYNGGPVANTPRVHLMFAGDWTSAANQTRATRLAQFMTDLLTSGYMNIMSQYGCGSTGNVAGSAFIANANNNLSGPNLQSLLQGAINSNSIPEPTSASDVYVLFLDDATAVNDAIAGAVMCEPTNDNAFGFHTSFTTNAGNQFYFAVVPGLTDACVKNSCPGGDGTCSLQLTQAREQRQTQVLSHEFAEMISDPGVGSNEAWSRPTDPSIKGDPHENGDICNGKQTTLTVGANTWTVQAMYSKTDDMNSSGATICVGSEPFPLPSLLPACAIALDRSTYGKDEIDALLHLGAPATIQQAFFVIVDGYTPAQLGITAASLTGAPNVTPTVTLAPQPAGMAFTATALTAADPSLSGAIQRFTWTYSVTFNNDAAFTQENEQLVLTATIAGHPGVSVTNQAIITLTEQPNPYEVDGPTSWLSVDLQVFQVQQGGSLAHTPGVTLNNPNAFIAGLLSSGAGSGGYNDPALARAPNHPFDLDLVANEDTSTVEWAGTVNSVPVYNFAVARVRYRALATAAPNVRVFFRMFQAATSTTDFQPTTTYLTGGQGGAKIPLLGVVNNEVVSVPFFAAPRVDPTQPAGLNAQTDPANVGPVGEAVPPDGSGAEVQVYFGCWLDINQTTLTLPTSPAATGAGPFTPTQSIQQAIRGKHQCLVAEINFDPDPVATGVTPANSDKLAQRNLTVVGTASPHLIPQTFDIRPTRALLGAGALPDELMLEWGGVPADTTASVYLPGTSADLILDMANRLYPRHGLSRVDDQTIGCTARGITYMPIPPGGASNFAGLLTLDLPDTVRRGDVYHVVTRQLTGASGRLPAPPPQPPRIAAGVGAADQEDIAHWRRVVGTFQLTIPVTTPAALLVPEERLLAVLRYVTKTIPSTDRWFPVMQRYLDVVEGRVQALGGDPTLVQPSPQGFPSGEPHKPHREHVHHREHTGKVAGLIFDHFGDFEGFLLETPEEEHRYLSRKRNLAELAERAWREQLRIRVITAIHEPHRPLSIVVLDPPRKFDGG